MYREEPQANEDSGWRFMAGDESEQYMADPENIGVYALNSLANYDRDIVVLLDSPPGVYFARQQVGGPFVQLLDDDNTYLDPHSASASPSVDLHSELNPEFPAVTGDYQITQDWQLSLAEPYNRRIEDGTMVLWRPGLTIHIVAWDNTPGDSIKARVDQLLATVPEEATNLAQVENAAFTRVTYEVQELSLIHI